MYVHPVVKLLTFVRREALRTFHFLSPRSIVWGRVLMHFAQILTLLGRHALPVFAHLKAQLLALLGRQRCPLLLQPLSLFALRVKQFFAEAAQCFIARVR